MRTVAAIALGILLGALTYVAGSPNVSADVPAAAHAVDAAACMRLTSFRLPNMKITSADVVAAGAFKPPTGAAQGFSDLPEFCRVAMTLTPSSDSDIKSETWLPLSGWNGKFQEVGNGGWNGFINTRHSLRRCAEDTRPRPPIRATWETPLVLRRGIPRS